MKLSKYIVILLTALSFQMNEAKAQIDTVFWFSAPWLTPDHWWRDPMAFHFSTFGNTTTIRVQQPASTYDTTIVVPPNTLFTKYISFMMDSVESKPANTVLRTGFKISSDFPITVVYDIITRSPNFYNPETFSLKGQNGMGTEFVMPFQTLWRNQNLGGDLNGDGTVTQPYQQFSVVATEDNTTIYITPRCNVVGGHPANVTYSVFLPRKGNVYTCQNVTQITNVVGSNLAGSIVVSDKPVSVTVGDDSVNPSGGGGCFDMMGDQIVPVDVIGKEYIVNKGFLNPGSNESIFIVATENFTSLTINNGFTTTTATLNQGDTYPYSITQNLTYVNADKNVYVLHMSGYGCELGEAILPPLNCAGSDQISFSRANGQSFLLNILCKAGTEGSFVLNGSATLVPAAAFSPVPGTGGAWMGAQISYSTASIPVGTANLITNSMDNFSLGIINGGATTGCLYHYVSSFLRRVYTKAGNDTTLCNGNPSINLNGSVTGGSTTGIWTVLDGTGAIATPTNLSTTYAPTASDYAQGYLTFVLSSTGNCNPVTDTMKVTFIQSPIVNAGLDDSYCKNNVDDIPINGTLSFAAGASWSGGSGGAFANSGDLSTTYTPSPADLANDSVVLYLTSAGSFFACPNDKDTIVIHFTEPPVVAAGPDVVICSNTPLVSLNGSVTGVTSTGIWSSSGAGAFSPSDLNLSTDYLISSTDTSLGTIYLTLTSTNNGNCNAVKDSLMVTILNRPIVTITSSDSVCANLSNFALTGTVTSGFSSTWTTTGFGSIVSPASLSTIYNVSPVDTTAGFVDIILSTNGGICPVEDDTLRVIFIHQPLALAGTDQAFCSNEVIQLNGVITGGTASGSWTSTGTGAFVPGNNFPVTTYVPSSLDVSSGSIQLILTTNSVFGCVPDDDTLNVTFKAPPVADFTNTVACQGDNTSFTDMSTTSAGTVNSWNWDFGDFTVSIAENPLHNYGSSGTFNVTLIAGSSNGCYDTIQKTITVNPLPIADFTYGSACQGTPIQFLDNSFIASGSINMWNYDFGDGNSSSLEDPMHTYPSVGSYTVTYEVTSALGCSDTVVKVINVLDRPNAAFTANPNPGVALEDITFTDLSTGAPLVDWYWNFGDSTGTNTQNAIHNYANGGIYYVDLVVTDENGCVDTARTEIVIALLPVLPTAFTPNGDNENDVFIIRGGPFDATDFKIYNNWGELIFSTNDANVGWDGTFKGEPQPIGVYTWTFEVQIVNGRIITKSGDVTLMR